MRHLDLLDLMPKALDLAPCSSICNVQIFRNVCVCKIVPSQLCFLSLTGLLLLLRDFPVLAELSFFLPQCWVPSASENVKH